MAKVYATTPGAAVQVDFYGVATETEPCRVPEAVGLELAGAEGLRVELEEAAAAVVPELPARRRKGEHKPSALEGVATADQVKEG